MPSMIVTLIYVPTVSPLSQPFAETGSWKWTGITVAYTITLGWVIAVIVYQVGTMLGLSLEPLSYLASGEFLPHC